MYDNNFMSQLLEGKTAVCAPLLSGSMAPFLLPGDDLYIEPIQRKLRSGDIAVFFDRGKFYSHRVLFSIPWGKRRFILEKGDANHKANLLLYTKAIGKVTRFQRDDIIQDLTTDKGEKISRIIARQSLLNVIFFPYIFFIKSLKRRLMK